MRFEIHAFPGGFSESFHQSLLQQHGIYVLRKGPIMPNNDITVLEMLGCIYEELDIDNIEKRFVDLVSDVFSFDRIALFFVKHKKEVLQGKLSKGFDPEIIKKIEIPIKEKSIFIKPLVTGIPVRKDLNDADPHISLLDT